MYFFLDNVNSSSNKDLPGEDMSVYLRTTSDPTSKNTRSVSTNDVKVETDYMKQVKLMNIIKLYQKDKSFTTINIYFFFGSTQTFFLIKNFIFIYRVIDLFCTEFEFGKKKQ